MSIRAALLVGSVGDLALQGFAYNSENPNLFGLKTYFDQHGSFESMFTAAGMLAIFTGLYKAVDPSLMTGGLVAYGTILDLAFRYLKLFPSLEDYYKNFSVLSTIIFAIIPFLMIKYLS